MRTAFRLEVLGTPRLVGPEGLVPLAPRPLSVLTALGLHAPRPVAQEILIEAIWGTEVPKSARASLQNAVAAVRSEGAEHQSLIETSGPGYRLGDDVHLDADDLGALLEVPASRLVAEQVEQLELLLARWDTEAYQGLAATSAVEADRNRLRETRSVLLDRLGASLLASHRPHDALRWLQPAVIEDSGRPARAGLLALALYRTGNVGDAVRVVDLAERGLVEQSGIGLPRHIGALRGRFAAADAQLDEASIVEELLRDAGGSSAHVGAPGRRREIEQAAAWIRQGRSVVIRGVAGIGKSVMLDALIADAGSRSLMIRCLPDPGSPYEPLLDLVDRVLAAPGGIDAVKANVVRADGPALAWVAPSLRPLLANGDVAAIENFRRERADRSLVELLVDVLADLRLTVFVDDLHHAPRASQRLIGELAQHTGAPIIVATRPGVRMHVLGDVDVIDLDPFDATAAADVLRSLLGDRDGDVDDVAATLSHTTGGNAFFLVATVRHLLDAGALRRVGGTWGLTASPKVAADVDVAVRERLGRLSAGGRQLVELLAVANTPLEELLVERAHRGSTRRCLDETVDEAVVCVDDGRVRLVHELFAEAVRGQLAPARLLEEHDHLASVYAESARPDRLARVASHRYEARALDPQGALDALEAAATAAADAAAHEFAVIHLQRAREIVGAPASEDGLRLAVAEGWARRLAGDPGHVDLLIETAQRAHDVSHFGLAADALTALGDVGELTSAGGADARIRALADEVLGRLDDPRREALLQATASVWFTTSSDGARAQELWAAALATAESVGDDELVATVLRLVDWGTDGPHLAEFRRDQSARGIDLAARLRDPLCEYRCHIAAVGAAMSVGTAGDIDLHLDALRRLEPIVHNGFGQRLLGYKRAGRALLAGDLELAEVRMEQATQFPSRFSDSWDTLSETSVLLGLRFEQMRGDELAPLVDLLIAEHPDVPMWRIAAARCRLDSGDLDAVAALMANVDAELLDGLVLDQTWSLVMIEGLNVATALRDRRLAELFASRLERYIADGVWCGHAAYDPVAVSLARHYREIGDYAAAADAVDHVYRVADRLDAPIVRARADAIAMTLVDWIDDAQERWPELIERAPAMLATARDRGWVAVAHELEAAAG